MYPVILFLIAIVAGVVQLKMSKQKPTYAKAVETFLAYIILMNIGIAGLIGFIGHIFYGPEIAKMIGWAPYNPFQYEVGVANLALAVVGIIGFWIRRSYWIATVLAAAIFSLGAAWVHIWQMSLGNQAPYNTGIFLYAGDIGIPLIYLVLMFIYVSQNKSLKS